MLRGKEHELNKITKLRCGIALVASIAASAVLLGGATGTATGGLTTHDATIKMVGGQDSPLRFKAPESVGEGDVLRVVNRTNPNQVGPHTFSLVRHDVWPRRSEYRDCERLEPGTMCREIAQWHDALGPSPQAHVEAGKTGWNKKGDFQEEGDSFFVEAEGDADTRVVSREGGKLHFICAVHPFMRGKVPVDPLN